MEPICYICSINRLYLIDQNEIDWILYSGVKQGYLISIHEKTSNDRLKTNIVNKLYGCHYYSLCIVN